MLNGSDPPPSLHGHYTRFIITTRWSAPTPTHRYFQPRGFCRLYLSLSIAGEVLTFRTRAKLRFAPSTCRMSLDRSSDSPPSLSRKKGQPPVLTSSNQLSTLHQRFAYARLSQPCLPRSCPDFFCNAHHHRFWRQQLAVAREQHLTAVLEGPSFISRTVMQRRLDRRYS
jgi:hypothetical protein